MDAGTCLASKSGGCDSMVGRVTQCITEGREGVKEQRKLSVRRWNSNTGRDSAMYLFPRSLPDP